MYSITTVQITWVNNLSTSSMKEVTYKDFLMLKAKWVLELENL